MPANNIHVLSPVEMKVARDRFSYELKDDCIMVKVNGHNRVTAHRPTGFIQTFKVEGKLKKISITQQTIKYWIDNFRAYSIIDVQNAVNMLLVTYQEVNADNIRRILKNPESIKIRKV